MTPERTEKIGQYILGLLEDAEREAFEAEMARDQELRSAVSRLSAHLQQLDDTVKPEVPSSGLWARIEDALEHPQPEVTQASVRPQSRFVRPWRQYAMAASLLLALGVGYLAGNLGRSSEPPLMIAVLLNEGDATPGAIVEAFADDSVRLVPLEQFNVPAGKVLQVWTLPDPQSGPVSLGTLDDPASITLTGPDLPAPKPGQLYEVTLEPAPGSPTGRPTGPILVKGYARAPV